MQMPSPDLTVSETAKRTGFTRARLYQLIGAGEVPHRRIKVEKIEIRIPEAIVEELLARRTQWNERSRVGEPGMKAGAPAGSIHSDGYRYIRIAGQLYRTDHLAFSYMTGSFPSGEVEHIDEDKANDAWANLRLIED
jgi:predicted DNA-binding transcriptional regulator AlpA